MIKRTLYLGYYFKQMKWDLLKKFLSHTSRITGKSKAQLMLGSIRDVYSYNISILEYFQFGFYEKTPAEKEKWAGTGTMYEFQKKANPLDKRSILDDKRLFYENYAKFIKHKLFKPEELEDDKNKVDELFANHEKLVLKEARGKVGAGVRIISTASFKKEDLIPLMKKRDFGILETFIQQHPDLQKLSPSAVNTVRVITQIRKDGTYELLGCRLRISVDSPVDNLGAGNIVVSVDEKTGKVTGKAVYSDITKPPVEVHPVTGVLIPGFQIPFWDEILSMVKEAALSHPENCSIGWDVVITPDGPGFIEGNHDWCKLVWQLPIKKGLKHRLESY